MKASTSKKLLTVFAAGALSTGAAGVYANANDGYSVLQKDRGRSGSVRVSISTRHISTDSNRLKSGGLAAEFEARLISFINQTRVVSSVDSIMLNPLYSELVGFGPVALPWLLSRLGDAPMRLMPILAAISRENPVTDLERGKVPRMVAAWLDWGRSKGFC